MVIKREDGCHVISEKTGKNLGGQPTLWPAEVSLRQVGFFMHNKEASNLAKKFRVARVDRFSCQKA